MDNKTIMRSEKYDIGVRRRFWNKVIQGKNPDDCWGWDGAHSYGYPALRFGKTTALGTHISFEIHHGPLPYGHIVRHTCDNPGCSNPRHLVSGTQADNMLDMAKRGRWGCNTGRRPRYSKVTELQRRSIIMDSRSDHALAKEYGISPSQIWRIRNGKSWGSDNG